MVSVEMQRTRLSAKCLIDRAVMESPRLTWGVAVCLRSWFTGLGPDELTGSPKRPENDKFRTCGRVPVCRLEG